MSVVDLQRFREEREEEAWRRYAHARAEAERTGDIAWGRAVGRAWRAWLDTFQSPAQNEAELEFRRVVSLRQMGTCRREGYRGDGPPRIRADVMRAGPVPPHAMDSEQALLGAILHNNDAIDIARQQVEPADFFEAVHRHIFEVMCARHDAGEPIDRTLMRAVLGDADLGGVTVGSYLAKLYAEATTVMGAPGYARLIAQAAQMRRVLATAQEAVTAMTAGSVHAPPEYAAEMIEAFDEVASAGLAEHARRVTLGRSAGRVLARVAEAREGRVPRGVPYGVPKLDAATLGLRPAQLIVLSGRPGMGKTTVALHVALSAARRSGAVGFFSLEMDADELTERMLAALSYDPRAPEPITYRAIAEARGLSPEALWRLQEARQACEGIPHWMEPQSSPSLAVIASRSRQMRLKAERSGMPLAATALNRRRRRA